jgi:hypothetical protein
MDSLNLDIDTYTVTDLMRLFTLNGNYGQADIDNGKRVLLHQLTKLTSLGPDEKNNIHFFIDSAAGRLISHINKPDPNAHTWSQKENPIMDSGTNYVINPPSAVVGAKANIIDGRTGGSGEAPPGWINPINVRTIQQGINIDTRFRENYYNTSSSDYHVSLHDTQKNVTTMRVGTLDIPMTFYGVDRARGDATFLILKNEDTSTNAGSWEPPTENPPTGYINYTDPSKPQKYPVDLNIEHGVDGWLVIIPDGNYEMSWQSSNLGNDLVEAVNLALSIAQPGVLDKVSGKFYIGTSNDIPILNKGLDTKNDLVYDVNQACGKSLFAIPTSDQGSSQLHNGFKIQFAVDAGGNLSLEHNIQLRAGWQFGYRLGGYDCTINKLALSEGICMITGPRYLFLSIDDGLTHSASNLSAAFSQSILHEHILTRINISSAINDVGSYKCASDIGLSNQLNRTREYFGPVDVSRLKIKMMDEYGRVVNLHNMDWSMTIVFDKLYTN